MAEVKLEPGWLTRDIVRAAQRAEDWKNDKGPRSNRNPSANQESDTREDKGSREPKA